MRKRSTSCDVAVIGGGLSGMLAAAAARRSGARVALLADGHGMLELSTGCIDLLGATPAGDPIAQPWEALAALDRHHPYSLVGTGRVCAALAGFQQIAQEEDVSYAAPANERNQWMATALGHLRPTYLRPASAVSPEADRPLWVVGLRGFPEFQPEVVAEGLRLSLPGTPVAWFWADLPEAVAHPIQIARLVDRPAAREALVRSLAARRPAGPAPALVLFPAVLGIDRTDEVRAALAAVCGAPIGEVPLLSPSVPGLRLANRLRHHLERSGVDVRMGLRVTAARKTGDRVEAVVAQSPGGPVEVAAGAFILAAGGLLGKGIEAEGHRLVEPIFDLSVEGPPPGPWADPELLPVGGHPFVRAGVRTDERLRPEGYRNLFACGRMLAGYDPYAEGSGGGVAIATGWHAGELAGGAAR